MHQPIAITGNKKLAKEDYVTQPVESILIAWNRFYKSNLYTALKVGIFAIAVFVVASTLLALIAGSALNAALSEIGGISILSADQWTNEQAAIILSSIASVVAMTVVIYALAMTPFIVALNYVAIMSQNNQPVTVGASLNKGFKRFFVAIGAYALALLAITSGLVLFVIPGIYVLLRLSYIHGLIVNEDIGPIEVLKRSWQLTSGNLWDIVGVLSAIIVASSIATIVFRPMTNALAISNGVTAEVFVAVISLIWLIISVVVQFALVLGLMFRYHQSDLEKQSRLTKTHTDKLNYIIFVLALFVAPIAKSIEDPTNR